jgi:hypothetical protein
MENFKFDINELFAICSRKNNKNLKIRFYLTYLYESVLLEIKKHFDGHTKNQIDELRDLFGKCQTWKGNKCKMSVSK